MFNKNRWNSMRYVIRDYEKEKWKTWKKTKVTVCSKFIKTDFLMTNMLFSTG